MVKLNELEELAKPLLRGTLGASTSEPHKDVVMYLDEADRLHEEVNEVAQFSPYEGNFGLV